MNTEQDRAVNETLGAHIRGGRLGYRWAPALGCYMRIRADQGDGWWWCDLARHARDMTKSKSGEHRCWWEDAELADDLQRAVRFIVSGQRSGPLRLRRAVTFRAPDNYPVPMAVAS